VPDVPSSTEVVPYGAAASTVLERADHNPSWYADADPERYGTPDAMLTDKMSTLVKGAGYCRPGGNRPLDDDDEIFRRSMRAETSFRRAIKNGVDNPDGVVKSLSPEFAGQFGAFMAASPQNQAMQALVGQLNSQLSDIMGKSITLTSPLNSGFVPFDLVAPSSLIYPVYSPIRNKLARVPGQGVSRRRKVITGISGSQTGTSGGSFLRLAIPELVQSGGAISGTSGNVNWPLNLPGTGTQNAVDLTIPYRFWGLSENLSWLAQFSGQGFEDISALANLLLLQEFMLNEEAAHLGATSIALTTPSAPTLTARAPNSGETAITGPTSGNNVYVEVVACTFFGGTTAGSSQNVTWTTGQVVDVQIAPVAGAQYYQLYVTYGSSAGTYYLMVNNVGGLYYTLQGAIPTTGTAAPTADTGTSSANDQEGLTAVLSGHSASGGSAIYPTSWQAGYLNQSVGDTLKTSVLNNALQQLWDGTGNTYGAFRADPAEIMAEGGDIMRLSNDVVSAGAATNYRLFVEQSEVPGVRVGAAVSEFQNPITRNPLRIVVHPWTPQGTVYLMSYTMPFAWSNVSNVVEFVAVQDYLSISWPVIDASFRYSMFLFGALVVNAPFYCGLLQGIQKTDRSGAVGTWS
jgi:hypothetical protein